MTPRQRKHLVKIQKSVHGLIASKYRRGAEEHGDTLLGMSPLQLVEEAIEEAIDQLVFLLTAKAKLSRRSRRRA